MSAGQGATLTASKTCSSDIPRPLPSSGVQMNRTYLPVCALGGKPAESRTRAAPRAGRPAIFPALVGTPRGRNRPAVSTGHRADASGGFPVLPVGRDGYLDGLGVTEPAIGLMRMNAHSRHRLRAPRSTTKLTGSPASQNAAAGCTLLAVIYSVGAMRIPSVKFAATRIGVTRGDAGGPARAISLAQRQVPAPTIADLGVSAAGTDIDSIGIAVADRAGDSGRTPGGSCAPSSWWDRACRPHSRGSGRAVWLPVPCAPG